MSRKFRQMAEESIRDSRVRLTVSDPRINPTADWYEGRILSAMEQIGDESDTVEALGKLLTISTDLLELTRRTDPSYGLTAIDR